MYVNGNGFRGIERSTGVSHNTQIDWVKQAAKELPSIPENYDIPEVAEIDELHTYVNEKKNKKWLWTVVNHFKPGIIRCCGRITKSCALSREQGEIIDFWWFGVPPPS
ncbi:MAG: hypothetical protein GDA48_06165 [Hormoscilla sp. GM102CHS1]|nr:hypothetical protein [Hormoscilla sp. GM102CHS1]